MDVAPSPAIPAHRAAGMPLCVETEIGIEKRCLTCGEYWPADAEFFEPKPRSKDRLSPRCIACIKARNWAYHAQHYFLFRRIREMP